MPLIRTRVHSIKLPYPTTKDPHLYRDNTVESGDGSKKNFKLVFFKFFPFFLFPSQLCLSHFELCLGANTAFAPALPDFEQPWGSEGGNFCFEPLSAV